MQAFFLFFTVAMLATGTAAAQQGLVATGGDASSATGSVSYSIGQPVFQQAGNASGLVIAGLQQPMTAGTPLPLSLLYFTATANTDHTVRLQWTTASADNADYFTVERSADGSIFNKLEQVAATGNAHTKQDYSAADPQPYDGITYYRLKQVDKDGAACYSPVQKIQFGNGAPAITAAPNPASNYFQLFMHGTPAAGYEYRMVNTTGQLLLYGSITSDITTIDLSNLASATYLLQIVRQAQVVEGFKISKR